MASFRSSGKKKSITIRDLVIHLQGMEQRLSKRIDDAESGLLQLSKKLDVNTEGLHSRINELESNLTERINDLDKDIMAAMSDTIDIKRHVGMHVPDEG